MWSYGTHCRGQDVPDEATSLTTKDVFAPGVYYLQVTIAGEASPANRPCSYRDKGLPTECLSLHYSGVSA